MNRFIITALILSGAYLAGCSTISGVLGANGTDDARKAAGAAMTVYGQSWQPMLKIYGNLAVCSSIVKAPCQDAKLYRKLYDLDGAAATCIVAATLALNTSTPDFSPVTGCISQINTAELAFAQAGIVK